MLPVYTLLVDGAGVPFSLTAELAPSIGDVVDLNGESSTVRVVRSADGGRIFVAEPVTEDG
jgi:hypothetical protein